MSQTKLVEFVKTSLMIQSDAALARALGQSPASLNAKKVRGTIDLVQIRDLFVRNGKDPKLLDDFLNPKPTIDNTQQQFVNTQSLYRSIPEYNIRVSAGHGEFVGIEAIKETLQVPRKWLPENGQVGLVRVEGDSMYPTVNNGDYVAVEFGSGYTSDGLYLIRVEDAVYVKKIQKEFGSIRIISDNPQYREMSVSPDDGSDFGLIGRVALIVRKT